MKVLWSMTYGDYKNRDEEMADSNFALNIWGCGSVVVWGGIITAIVWAGGFWPMVQIFLLLTLGSILIAIGTGILWFLRKSR